MGNDLDLAITDLGDLDGLAQVADAAVDLDLLVQELLEGGNIEDLVAGGLRGVDDELQDCRQHCARKTGGSVPRDVIYLLGGLGRPALLLRFLKFDLSLLHHAMISLAERLGQQQSGVMYIQSGEPLLLI